MTTPQYQTSEQPGAVTVALAMVAVAIITAVFWASIVWLVWGWFPAAVTAIVAVLGSILLMGIVRSGGDNETPEPTAWNQTETPHDAPWTSSVQQAA